MREYVVATAAETGHDVELILPLIPELHDFAGHYLDGGAFLVAEPDANVAGCVGVTPGADGTCEMNRLWIRPDFRRVGLGRDSAEASMDVARELGFRPDGPRRRARADSGDRALPQPGIRRNGADARIPFAMVFLARNL